jgi:RNA polymerase sigma factor (sigma-70 family)
MARTLRLVTSKLRRLGAYDVREDWDDISQEVVWALVRAVRDGRGPSRDKIAAYVGNVVRNRFVSWLRSRDARPDVHRVALGGDGDGAHRSDFDSTMKLHDRNTDSEERFATKQALARLPEDWQALLVAHYVEGRTVATLVAASGRSRASVNRDLQRAREAFRMELLGDDGGPTAAEAASASRVAVEAVPASTVDASPRVTRGTDGSRKSAGGTDSAGDGEDRR